MSLVRCHICHDVLDKRDAVQHDHQFVPGHGTHHGWAHPACAASPSHLPEEGDHAG